jgi:hypothetical protein
MSETYSTIKQCLDPIPPIPEPYICIYIPPEHSDLGYLGIKDTVRSFVLNDISDDPQGDIRSMLMFPFVVKPEIRGTWGEAG